MTLIAEVHPISLERPANMIVTEQVDRIDQPSVLVLFHDIT
jgi:hypothetical protein